MKLTMRFAFFAAVALLALLPAGAVRAEVPYNISNLTVTGVSATQINLTWTAPFASPAITGYLIEREIGLGGGFTVIVPSSTLSTAASYADTSLAPNTVYNYRVTAYNADGANYPAEAAGTTKVIANASLPPAPIGLVATAMEGFKVSLAWTAVSASPAVTGYILEREIGIGNGFALLLPAPTSTATTYVDTNLAAGATYNYRVFAVSSFGTGSPSQSAAAGFPVLPGPPENLTATAGDGQITLAWTPPFGASGITYYMITGASSTSQNVTGTARSAVLTGLTNGTEYTLSVTAGTLSGRGPAASARPTTPRAAAATSTPTTPAPVETPAAPIIASTSVQSLQDQINSLLALLASLRSRAQSATTAPAGTVQAFTRDAAVGTRSEEVRKLQTLLISKNIGPAATKLKEAGATGYFWLVTKAALTELQANAKLSTTGRLDQATRAYLNR